MYCIYTDVRAISGLTQTEISDADLTALIAYAIVQLNADINIKIIREKVEWLDDTRENNIDSSNATYYVKNWKHHYLGDLDNDGDVDISDVEVYLVAPGGTETVATVSSVTHDEGKIVLSAAPTSSNASIIYITYAASPVDESTPDSRIKLACAQLTAALAFTRIDAKKIAGFSIGKIKVTKQSQAFDIFYNQYLRTVNRIKQYPIKKIEGIKVV